jgi:hypothetical protein
MSPMLSPSSSATGGGNGVNLTVDGGFLRRVDF